MTHSSLLLCCYEVRGSVSYIIDLLYFPNFIYILWAQRGIYSEFEKCEERWWFPFIRYGIQNCGCRKINLFFGSEFIICWLYSGYYNFFQNYEEHVNNFIIHIFCFSAEIQLVLFLFWWAMFYANSSEPNDKMIGIWNHIEC